MKLGYIISIATFPALYGVFSFVVWDIAWAYNGEPEARALFVLWGTFVSACAAFYEHEVRK